MRQVLFILLVGFVLQSEAQRKNKGQVGISFPVQCPQFTASLICKDSTTFGKKYFDGCNRCRCSSQEAKISTCQTTNDCPTLDSISPELNKKATQTCARLTRKNGRKQKKQANKAQQVFHSCINITQHCTNSPSVSFFDGCNQCTCLPSENNPDAQVQTSCTKKLCPGQFPFKGNRRQFKKFCKRIGAKVNIKKQRNGRQKCMDGFKPNGKPCKNENRRTNRNRIKRPENENDINQPNPNNSDLNEFKAAY